MGAGSGGAGCGEGVSNDQCKSKRTEWTDDCTTSGPYGGYCGTRVREEIFQIGGACDPQVYSPTNCNSYATNTGNSPTAGPFTTGSGDTGDGPWGATGTMASATSHMNFLTDGLLMGDLLSDAMWGFIAEMTGEGDACGANGDKFCCVPISANYAQQCTNQVWVAYPMPKFEPKVQGRGASTSALATSGGGMEARGRVDMENVDEGNLVAMQEVNVRNQC